MLLHHSVQGKTDDTLQLLEIKTSRSGEETPEAMKQFLLGLSTLKKSIIPRLWGYYIPFSLELAVIDQLIYFYVSIAPEYQNFLESQLVSQYPKALISRAPDYLPKILEKPETLAIGQMKAMSNLYPLRTFKDFKDVDPFSNLLGVLSKSQIGDSIGVQLMLAPAGPHWQRYGEKQATSSYTDSTGKVHTNQHSKDILLKTSVPGFYGAIRIAVNTPDKLRSNSLMLQIANTFSTYSSPLNALVLKKPWPWRRKKLMKVMLWRSNAYMPRWQVFNVEEIASLYHFPSIKLANIHNISWHKVILSDPPENLPVAENLSEEEKAEVNFIAKTEYKNKMTVFGIKKNDRRRHVYIIGKTGSGKSTLIANMAINDLRNKRGFAIIDPHGDLCEVLLDYIPSFRINDVVYVDPSKTDRSISLNPLEVTDEAQRELIVSGMLAIFKKIYGTSWGPRLEYILRNTLLSVSIMPQPTLLMVPEMLGNDRFRAKVVDRLEDPVLRSFWLNEFANYTDKLRAEAVSPIQNKVGQFLASTVMRNILRHPTSTIDLRKIMDEGKILLLNLSQGKIGEDNAALLGAMFITKIQLAAMGRVNVPEEERRDFYLYVDEFQNFATTSFIKILSEARKYRLNLILANQYIAQIDEDVRAAIFGNAGTLLSFLVGATDALYLAKEFKERFTEQDLLALGNYRAIIKLAIDNVTQPPFLCYSLPLPRSVTQSRDKVLKSSLERYTKPVVVDKFERPKPPENETPSVGETITSDAKAAEKVSEGKTPTPETKQPMPAPSLENESMYTTNPALPKPKFPFKPKFGGGKNHGGKNSSK